MRIQKTKAFDKLPSFLERLLRRLNEKLLSFSRYLQKKTNSYSETKKKWILVLFCGVFASVSTLIIIGSLKREYLNPYSVTPIRVIPLIKNKILKPGISDKEFKQMLQYEAYLGSLPKASKDSILFKRPNLEDTINYLETLYRNQIKK